MKCLKGLSAQLMLAFFALILSLAAGDQALAQAQPVQEQTANTTAPAQRMKQMATRLINATPASQREKLVYPFDEQLRSDWHYTPRSRDGLAMKDMSAAQLEAARELLSAPLTDEGLRKIDSVMQLEQVLRDAGEFAGLRVPGNYAIAIYGLDGIGGAAETVWGWRIEGHHLSLHFTLQGDQVVSTLPQFIGANPAQLTPTQASRYTTIAKARPLGAEQDAAFALLATLDAAQRKSAVFSTQTYGDIQSRNASSASALDGRGITWGALNGTQQQALMNLIEQFAAHLKPALKNQRMQAVRNTDPSTVRFAWAGSTNNTAAGRTQPHYFRIQSATYLIEFDNSGGNHIHSVWRDFKGDWGRDVLAEHYRKHAGKGKHRH